MENRGIQMVKMDVDELLTLLNKALADEWLAHYQYWVGAKVVAGPMSDAAATELLEHATEEMTHAELLATRIDQLGGTPILEPKEWYTLTNCGYDAPTDPYVKAVLEQNIKGEQCAIMTYKAMLNATKDKDPVTYNMALQILQDEVEHEEDLQGEMEDLEDLLKRHGA